MHETRLDPKFCSWWSIKPMGQDMKDNISGSKPGIASYVESCRAVLDPKLRFFCAGMEQMLRVSFYTPTSELIAPRS